MKSISLAVWVILVVLSPSFGQNLNELNWIQGEWEMIDGNTTTTESWKKLNDSTFVGNGITEKDGQIVFEEELSIELRNNQVTYTAILPNKTAHFALTQSSNQLAIFEDPTNDFPSKILYELIDDDMEITLLGIQNGEEQTLKLHFNKK